MTDLRDQLSRLLDGEPQAPYDIDHVVRSGRRARRRHQATVAVAGTLGAAGVAAAVAVPMVTMGGDEATVKVGSGPGPSPTASPTAAPGKCFLVASPPKDAKRTLARLVQSGRVGKHPSVRTLKRMKHDNRTVMEVCTHGKAPIDRQQPQGDDTTTPSGPPYHYSEDPAAIAARLGAHLDKRVSGFGLAITYTRPFSQESSNPDSGHPSYFGGNVDVHEPGGYADIGVQVTHEVTEQVPFTGDCTAAEHCTETTLPDGSVLRTGLVKAGRGDVVLTAEVHRPDGVVVQAQESNYPFGPDAGAQPHGDQPLTLDQLEALAKDAAFTF